MSTILLIISAVCMYYAYPELPEDMNKLALAFYTLLIALYLKG